MSRRCTVCAHPDREAIDLAIVRNATYRDIARRFGVDHEAVGRHAKAHVAKPEPEPTPAQRQQQADVEHRAELRVEKHHVIAGLLKVVSDAEVGSATVSAWREIGRLQAMYPDKNVHHTIEDITADDNAALDRLAARFSRRVAGKPTANGATRGSE